jgi:hypothetical protein
MGQKEIRARKHAVFEFIHSQEFLNWTVRISQKALTMGTKHFAEVSVEEKLITVNPHKTVVQFLESIVHEILHVLHPRSREATILRWEREVMDDMSPSERTDLLTSLFFTRRVVWDE